MLWLGKIPAHWEVWRTKHLLRERKQKGFPDEPLLAATQTKGVVRKEQYENRTVLALKDLHLLKLVRVGDFVISLRSFQGGIEYAREQGIISPAYTVLYPYDSSNQQYLAWLFKSKPYIDNLALFVTGIRQGQNIDYGRLSRSDLPLPSPAEQAAIARFLDHIDRRIRRYNRAKRKLIALLEEQKQALIQRAVTRGLDPNVRLKPSDLEWLGQVPEHWEIKRAKYYLREVNERSTTGEEELLSVSHITGVTPRSQKNITMFMASSYIGHKLCQPGDLAVNTMWVWMGALGIAKQPGIISPSYSVYRLLASDAFVPDFLDNLLRTKPYISEYVLRSTGIRSSRLRVYPEEFLKIRLVRPPYEEQVRIVEAIAQKTHHIDQTIAQTQREIDLVREYRTRLIADVVTGKLDVRQAAANLPEEIAEIEDLVEDQNLDETDAEADDGA